MYNGTGLQTPKGTGTSGHITKSLAIPTKSIEENKSVNKKNRKSKILILHELKRNIFVQCLKLKNKLKSEGENEDVIKKMVNDFKEQELKKLTEKFEKDDIN